MSNWIRIQARSRRTQLASLALASALLACRGGSQPRSAAPSEPSAQREHAAREAFATAVGWQVGAGTNGIATTGQFATQPGGREDALMPALPTATQGWISRCGDKLATRSARIDLAFTVTASGRLADAQVVGGDGGEGGPSALGRCFLEQLGQQTLPGLSLPADTHIALRLSLSKSA